MPNRFEKVDVLLGTLNGEDYIAEFMESLLRQENVKIRLIVSDDGSIDRTLSIIRSFSCQFDEVIFLEGPKRGAASNYWSMLDFVQNPFVAFADQDDIWRPNHLRNAIELMENDLELDLVIARLSEFARNKQEVLFPSASFIGGNPLSDLMQNYARGCGLVFRRNLLKYKSYFDNYDSVMHDQKIFILSNFFGKCLLTEKATVMYRIHNLQTSFIGKSKYRLSRLRLYRSNIQAILTAIQNINSASRISPWGEEVTSLAKYVLFPGNRIQLAKILIRSRLRNSWLENVVVKFLLLSL
jgi:glycosyltransferase involved in cell wall biosynthesis